MLAYLGLMGIYALFGVLMTQENFQDFINPENEIGQLLQSHFVALQFLLSPITWNQMGARLSSFPTRDIGRWLKDIHARIPHHMRKYHMWPISVSEALQDGSYYKEILESPRTLSSEAESMTEITGETGGLE